MPSCLIANQSEFSSNSIRCLRAISSGHEHLAALAHGLLANAQSQPVVVRINGGTRGIIAMPIFNSNTFSSTSCGRRLRFFDSHE